MTHKATFTLKEITTVDSEMICNIAEQAKQSDEQHFRVCLHYDPKSHVQEMIIAITREALFCPHRHPAQKTESIHLIEGEVDVFLFNDDGTVKNILKLRPAGHSGSLMYRLNEAYWHLPVCKSEFAVYHEVYAGPYDKELDVEFPCWGPQPDDMKGLRDFYRSLGAFS